MTAGALLKNVSIVLVHTKTPGNIGSVARCMMNMGLNDLILVRPPQDRDNDAARLAAGAEEVIRQAKRHTSLTEAVAGHHLVIGTSRHVARRRTNVRTPREAAERIVPLLEKNRVALVFGREVNGLDSDDLALCHELIAIPSSDAFPSLNLSHAVMIVAYEMFLAARSGSPAKDRPLAPAQDLEKFYEHLQKSLHHIGFLNAENTRHMMLSLRQLFGRTQMDPRELNILRGILSQLVEASRRE